MSTETKQSLHIGLLTNLQFFSCKWSFFIIWGLYGPILGHFEVLTPLQNLPPELNFLEYVLVWVQKQNSLHIGLDQFAIFFLWVVIFCLFGHTYPFHPPDTPKILCGILLSRYFPQNMFWCEYGNQIEPS